MLKTSIQGLRVRGPTQTRMSATYSVTKQHVHIATRKLVRGCLQLLQFPIKNDVDVPQFITDAKVANGADALTAKSAKQDAEIMNFSNDASKAIAKKLDKPSLSAEVVKKSWLLL